MPNTSSTRAHDWQFFRTGGFEQVRIQRAEDLRRLDELDPKQWAVLACPSAGLELDPQTLKLLDADGDGRISADEVKAAVRELCAALKDPAMVFEAGDEVPLQALDEGSPAGARLAETARQVLASVGRPQAEAVGLADFADPAQLFDPARPNGDGVVPAPLADDAALGEAITLIAATLGPRTDRSGQPGVDEAMVQQFFAEAAQVCAWHAQGKGGGALLPLGEETAPAAAAFEAVQAKVDDWFTRCRLAAFDSRAAEPLDAALQAYADLAPATLAADHAGIAALPLARVNAAGTLPLVDGLNPAWQARMGELRTLVLQPLLGELARLDLSQWQQVSARLEGWQQWQAARPATPVAALEPATLERLIEDGVEQRLLALLAHDTEAGTGAAELDALQRLLYLRRDLPTLLRNFVNLADFYDPERLAIFQAGTLFIDQRSCELVLRVSDMARHAAMAPLSGTYLVYCQCTRPGAAPMNIVAAVTAGEADDMMVPGRNGVFYDRAGNPWHASVVRIVTNPISVREAFWAPYRRVSRMISEQVQKFAAAQDKAVDTRAGSGLADASKLLSAPPRAPGPAAPAAPAATAASAAPATGVAPAGAAGAAPKAAPPPAPPFDIAKFAGIFAAMGLALGALGTAVAAIVTGLLALPAWKLPLVIAGVVLVISGPSMALAWLKLQRRNLGPLLDANGWAVNIRARINVPFGASLTQLPQRPATALLAGSDPFAEKAVPWGRYTAVGVVVAVALLALAWWL